MLFVLAIIDLFKCVNKIHAIELATLSERAYSYGHGLGHRCEYGRGHIVYIIWYELLWALAITI